MFGVDRRPAARGYRFPIAELDRHRDDEVDGFGATFAQSVGHWASILSALSLTSPISAQ